MKGKRIEVPKAFQEDVRRAVEILKEAGCTDIFLFGSIVEGQVRDRSDLDLAIRGCPQGSFFHLLGRLLLELDHPVDLVNLDRGDAFAQYLEKEGEFLQVG